MNSCLSIFLKSQVNEEFANLEIDEFEVFEEEDESVIGANAILESQRPLGEQRKNENYDDPCFYWDYGKYYKFRKSRFFCLPKFFLQIKLEIK